MGVLGARRPCTKSIARHTSFSNYILSFHPHFAIIKPYDGCIDENMVFNICPAIYYFTKWLFKAQGLSVEKS